LFAKADEESREVDEHGYPMKLGEFNIT
jgi:hypothetical protein